MSTTPLNFTASEAGSIKFTAHGSISATIQYKLNSGDWTDYTWGSDITVAANDVVYFKGDNSTFSRDYYGDYISFSSTGNGNVSGNVMSLVDSTCVSVTIPCDYCFASLFSACYNCTFDGVELPATVLTSHCYYGMFMGCSRLTSAPVLPAITLTEHCYMYMFYNCKQLISPPDLSTTTLANACYMNMFRNCTSLTTAPILPATTLIMNCYVFMFYGCSKLEYVSVSFTDPNYFSSTYM